MAHNNSDDILTFMNCQLATFLGLILLTFLPLNIVAHSGRTDSNGGHHDRKNGGYHYHTKSSQPFDYTIDTPDTMDSILKAERQEKQKKEQRQKIRRESLYKEIQTLANKKQLDKKAFAILIIKYPEYNKEIMAIHDSLEYLSK